MPSRYKKNNLRQLKINFDKTLPLPLTSKSSRKPKEDSDELMDYVRRLFIEVKLLRSEVRQLRQLLK